MGWIISIAKITIAVENWMLEAGCWMLTPQKFNHRVLGRVSLQLQNR
jgi:hypothetical protein